MAFELSSFAPDFFLAEGEPYDRDDLALNVEGRPISVWSAIQVWHSEHPDDWRQMAKELFGLRTQKDSELLMCEAVFGKIRETDTCTTLSSPVEVWIDPEGSYRIRVW